MAFLECHPLILAIITLVSKKFLHGLHGGPLAMLAAQNWNMLTGEMCECAIFGSPKLAWGDNAQRILNNAMILTNWINRQDAITRLPFKRWGYRHVVEHLVKRWGLWRIVQIAIEHQIYGKYKIYPKNWRRAA